MDKDKSQMNHHGFLHPENTQEEVGVNVGNSAEHESVDKEMDMDALEAKLFAMAKSRP